MARTASKRRIDAVDLTQSDNETEPSKRAPQKKQAKTTLPTPPASSQSKSGQNSSQSLPVRDGVAPATPQDDVDAEVTSSDDFDDNVYQALELYGRLDTKVVGLRYYNGQATMGEFVILKREPQNPYDSNAIRVDNVMGYQIGHIPRTMASKLAHFMDSGSLVVEGMLIGEKGYFDMPLNLRLFGTSDPVAQSALKQEMKENRLPTADLTHAERERKKAEKERQQQRERERKRLLKEAASKAGGVSRGKKNKAEEESKSSDFANLAPAGDDTDSIYSGPSMDDILSSTTSFNPRELGEVVDKYGTTEEQLSQLPMADQPKEITTNLLPYQRQGLAWMLDRENPCLPEKESSDAVQLWKRVKNGFTNVATNYTVSKEPALASGGILADDMGLGKTIQVISLLLADPARRGKSSTLIVCPLSVMSNWSSQIENHVREKHALRVFTYHGNSKKGQVASDFEKFDVVITTYETMAMEYLPGGAKSKPSSIPRKDGLFSVKWRRLVLDEGHNIRNPKSMKAQAAYALSSISQSKWVLTGTPIVNNLRDLYSHVKFIGLTGGLENQEVFSATLIRPLNQGKSEATMILQALMGTLCLRRMKDMKFVDLKLPELSSHKYSVEWLKHEREKYEAFQSEAKGLLLQYQTRKNAKGQSTYSHLLEVLLRLRQTCNHWKLCGERITNLMAILEKNEKVALNSENRKALQDLLQLSIESQEDCPICLESLHRPIITACAHVFGGECIERVIETQHKCPMCRAELADTKSLVEPSRDMGESTEPSIDTNTSSSKIEALLNILKASRKKDAGTKTVVFSQWTSFLDIVGNQLTDHGFEYCRLDGTMNATQRDRAMDSLAKDPECTIMLASLSVCSVGLNLVAASQVVLCDSWWAPAIEDQAVDRIYRLGQTKPVTVFRLVMEDSIEERVLEIQQEKRKLMMTAFGERTSRRGHEKSARLADIEKLLR